MKCLRSFPAGSSGGQGGLNVQHIRNILGALDEKYNNPLTDFINILLDCEFPTPNVLRMIADRT